jgi:hypothetical protein
MKVLIYGNRKEDDTIYDASTPEKEAAAYLRVFKELDEYWQCYGDLTVKWKPVYEKAKAGDAEAAKRLMNDRKNYEYEGFRLDEVVDPTVNE